MTTIKNKQNLLPLLLILLIFPLYLATLAHTLVLGDPTEYTFVANTLGIAHPPGYAFITLMGKLFQTLIPFGDIPWRMHLLSATSSTIAALAIYGTITQLTDKTKGGERVQWGDWGAIAGILTALTVATATNLWQHAIHANPHILTATFLVVNIFLLVHWSQTMCHSERSEESVTLSEVEGSLSSSSHPWSLYAFCLSAGLGVTHHPLTVFAFPAYTLFILVTRPTILKEGRTLLKMIGFALLGLSIWLYFPIRSAMQPVFGPHDMNTLDGFLNVVLARGLRVNLFHFGLADQWQRFLVFYTTLRLQYSLPIIALAIAGILYLLKHHWRISLLITVAFFGNYIFVINTVQDVMAYLLGLFLLVGLLSGIGFYALINIDPKGLLPPLFGLNNPKTFRVLTSILFFLLGTTWQLHSNLPYISLRHYSEGADHIEALFTQFAGTNQHAVLLHDWEHMTPVWYTQYIAGRLPDPADVRPEYVSTARPWVESVFAFLPQGNLYVNSYNPEIVAAGFRLRPIGSFYQVVETDTTLPAFLTPAPPSHTTNIVGYHLPQRTVTAGDFVPLTIALQTKEPTEDYYVPTLTVGDIRYPFTTDNHVISPLWQPNEVIVERFDFALPHHLDAGTYPLTLQLQNLSRPEDLPLLEIGTLTVKAQNNPVPTNDLLANFRQRVGLVNATARLNGDKHTAPWPDNTLTAHPNDTINLLLKWRCLASPEESYTIFVHLIDGNNRPLVALDYTPLGGATPTHLWIPKWLPHQQLLDPYRLTIPADLPAGTYYIEVGLYEMARGATSGRRLHMHDPAGNLIGDRYILGSVQITP